MPEPENLSAVTHEPEKLPAQSENGARFPVGLGGRVAIWSTLDFAKLEDKRLALAARDGECAPLESMLGKTLEVVHVLMHPAEGVNEETGEMTPLTRIVLICPDHKMYSCCSVGIYNSLETFWTMEGPGPWLDPLVVEPYQLTRKPPRRLFKLRFLGRKSELDGKKKK